jgi:hypothetical protein
MRHRNNLHGQPQMTPANRGVLLEPPQRSRHREGFYADWWLVKGAILASILLGELSTLGRWDGQKIDEVVRFIGRLILLLPGDTWSRVEAKNIRRDEIVDPPPSAK